MDAGDYKKADLVAGNEVNDHLNYFFSMGGVAADGYKNNDNSPLNIPAFRWLAILRGRQL